METDYTPWPGNPRASEREKLKFRIPCPTAMLDHIVSDTDRLPNLLQYKGCADVSVSFLVAVAESEEQAITVSSKEVRVLTCLIRLPLGQMVKLDLKFELI